MAKFLSMMNMPKYKALNEVIDPSMQSGILYKLRAAVPQTTGQLEEDRLMMYGDSNVKERIAKYADQLTKRCPQSTRAARYSLDVR